jgi:hypothetical protein
MKAMHLILVTALMIATVSMAAVDTASAKPLVFILSGQSNASGRGVITELSKELKSVPQNVHYFPAGSVEVQYEDMVNFGPEIGFSHAIAERYPDREIWIIKYAVGGSSMLAWKPNWSYNEARISKEEKLGPLYWNLLDRVREIIAGKDVMFGGVLWVQGEHDSHLEYAARRYAKNLQSMIRRLRVDLGQQIPFFLALVDNSRAWTSEVQVQEISLMSLENRVYPVPSLNLSKLPDMLHYDTRGQLELGARFANEYLRVVQRVRPYGTRTPSLP